MRGWNGLFPAGSGFSPSVLGSVVLTPVHQCVNVQRNQGACVMKGFPSAHIKGYFRQHVGLSDGEYWVRKVMYLCRCQYLYSVEYLGLCLDCVQVRVAYSLGAFRLFSSGGCVL